MDNLYGKYNHERFGKRLSRLKLKYTATGLSTERPIVSDARTLTMFLGGFMEVSILKWMANAPSLVDVRIYNLPFREGDWRRHRALFSEEVNDRLRSLLIRGLTGSGVWQAVMPLRNMYPGLCTLELCTPVPLQPFVGDFPPTLHTLILHAPISQIATMNGRASVLNWAISGALRNGLFANANAKATIVVKTDCDNPFGWELALAAAERYDVGLEKRPYTHDGLVAARMASERDEPWWMIVGSK
jgi:hypothetical protein